MGTGDVPVARYAPPPPLPVPAGIPDLYDGIEALLLGHAGEAILPRSAA